MSITRIDGFFVYPDSVHEIPGTKVFMAKTGEGDRLVIQGNNPGFTGEEQDGNLLAPLTHENARVLRRLFPFTAPRQGLAGCCSIGVGDRLGVAAQGHIRAFKRYPKVFPVFAQQSIRELTLTKRGYEDVLDCVSFAVFREGYTSGFGADGDHLKKPEEIEYALRCGYSMLTLDSSEHIRGEAAGMDGKEVLAIWAGDRELEEAYLDRGIAVAPGISLCFTREELARAALIYGEAIGFIRDIYVRYVEGKTVDFEVSIDETMTPTSPLQHYFVANELYRRGVRVQSLAPRFIGEFQKGIDYIGDLVRFDEELAVHEAIAEKFGYKISVHSGSDKFKVFPSVGRLCGGIFHLKTAGTNWLEAVRLAAIKEPAFYRRMHTFALAHFDEARKYYHVTTDISKIPPLESLSDARLPELMDDVNARQLLHITYGLILTAENETGDMYLRRELYSLLDRCGEDYAALLDGHIGRHLKALLG